jgi:uncharacterized protein YcnI
MTKKNFKLATVFSFVLISILIVSSIASAHVTVKPSESTAGSWETYTLKVPAEKESPTVKVTLKVPEQAELEQYQPVVGWKVTTDKDNTGKIKTISWEADKTGIGPGEFQQFNFVAKNPTESSDLAWDAFQYYSDGTVVEWTGDKGADKPHSITQIIDKSSNSISSGNDLSHEATSNSASNSSSAGPKNTGSLTTENAIVGQEGSLNTGNNDTKNSSGSSGMISLLMSIVALIVAIIAFGVSLGRRGHR